MRRTIHFVEVMLLCLLSGVILWFASRPVPQESVLASKSSWYQSGIDKASITEIVITNVERGLFYKVEETWDASNAGDQSVMAYRNGTTLILVYRYGEQLKLCEDASDTFAGFTALKSIKGLHHLDTSETANFSRFFMDCRQLETLQALRTWNTEKGENFQSMFENCTRLTTLDLRAWKMDRAQNMNRMFAKCPILSTIRIESWNCVDSSNEQFLYEAGYENSGHIFVSTMEMAEWVDRTDTLEDGGERGLFFVVYVQLENIPENYLGE